MAGNTFVIIGLRRRYAQTLGALRVAHGDRLRLMSDLTHLAHVIRMFAPGEDLEAIKPVRQWKRRRGRANWSRLALDVLRQANAPMTTRAIANRIAKAEGVTDPKTVASIECSLHQTLEKRIGEGVVRVEGAPKRWRLEGGERLGVPRHSEFGPSANDVGETLLSPSANSSDHQT